MDVNTAGALAIELMQKHGLLAKGWAFEWDNAKRRFGYCSYSRKLISMSRVLIELNPEPEVRDTILHEIAHALTGHNDNEAHHGWRWRTQARLVGARPTRCYRESDITLPKPKYIGRCVGCGTEVVRYKKTRRVGPGAYHVRCHRQGKESRIEWRKA